MDDVSIPFPADVIDLLVEHTTAHLACKRQRIYDLMSRRTIPHCKEGSRLLFKLSHLDAWIEGGAT